MFIWQYNLLLSKIEDYKAKSGKIISLDNLERFVVYHHAISLHNLKHLIRFGEKLQLIEILNNSGLNTTEMGRKFLEYQNRDNSRELSRDQKILLEEFFIKSMVLEEIANLIRLKDSNYVIIKRFTNLIEQFLITLLRTLSLIYENSEEEDIYYLSNKLYPVLDKIITVKQPYSEEDFLEKLEKQREIGELGEKIVLDFEKARVKKFALDLVKKIRHISKEYIDCGYDILSFNEDRSQRYIEVKSTNSNHKRFFISQNELKISREIGENYWLYFVMILKDEKKIFAFPNLKTYTNSNKFILTPTHFEVSWDFNEKDENVRIYSVE